MTRTASATPRPLVAALIGLGLGLGFIARCLKVDRNEVDRVWEEIGRPTIVVPHRSSWLEFYICASRHTIPGLPAEIQDRVATDIAAYLEFTGELLEAERARVAVIESASLTAKQKDALRNETHTLSYGRRTQVFVGTVVLVRYIWQLAEMTDAQILKRGADAGRKLASCTWMLDQIKEALKRRGLETGMKIPDEIKGIARA